MCSPEKPWYTPVVTEFLTCDIPRLLGIPQQLFARDVATLERRLAAEGESFLTKTLPAFGKAIDLALQGRVPLATASFKKRGRSALPAFLSALLRRVFKDDGWVRDEPCAVAIRLLRQVTLWHKKLQKGYSDESLQKAVEDFIDIDQALPTEPSAFAGSGRLLVVARAIVERIFRDIGSPALSNPSHGPGAVAGREGADGKRALATSYVNLEKVFRPIPWFRSLRDAAEDFTTVTGRPKLDFGLSRTEFVEKDSSGPRTIGLEPAEYMWCQQAVKNLMYNHIERRSIARGRVNFTDQSINRALALDWRRYETLDMSKASDRNSLLLVKTLFGSTRLWPYLSASRTPGTVLPDGRILLYRKFAPMGSAVCFPVQACVYYALACAALHLAGMPLFVACRKTYVYGDDLIVPRGYYSHLDAAFSAVGLKFNADKCCTEGRFRESCGQDAYDGIDVTPVRMRKASVGNRSDLARLVKHSNSLYDAGYWCTAARLRRLIESLYRKVLPKLPQSHRVDLPILTWRCTPEEEDLRYRFDSVTQTFFVKGWRYRAKTVVLPSSQEALYLRESLSRGGPVGSLHYEFERCDGPRSVRRELDLKYNGDLVKTKATVVLSTRVYTDEEVYTVSSRVSQLCRNKFVRLQ